MRATLTKATWMASVVIGMTFALASAAQAAAARTFVSALSGADANTVTNCALSAPCKTFAAAYGVTSSGGEVVALTPGGYGSGLSITTPVTINGNNIAEISVPPNSFGIQVSAPGAVVILKGLQITGNNLGGNGGVSVLQGTVVLEGSTLKYLHEGLVADLTHVDVVNSDFIGNVNAIVTEGAGVPYNSGAGLYLTSACPCTTLVRINGGNNIGNTNAFFMSDGTSNGFPSATIWILALSGWTMNVSGNTNLFGVDNTMGSPSVQTYSNGPAPN